MYTFTETKKRRKAKMSKPLEKGTYVDEAERVIGTLKYSENSKTGAKTLKLTTNKIRNLLSLVTELYNMVDKRNPELSSDTASHVQSVLDWPRRSND